MLCFSAKPHKADEVKEKHNAFMHLKTASLYAAISSTITSSNDGYRNYRDGDVIIGGLLDIHYYATSDQCTELFTTGLGYAEATIFTIEKINKNSTILPNMTIGYDLRDYCGSNARAMKMAYDLMFICNGDPVHMSNQNISIPSTGYVRRKPKPRPSQH